MNDTNAMTRKITKQTFAIMAAVPAKAPNPSTAATIAITRKTIA
jgi:hypothetical protein